MTFLTGFKVFATVHGMSFETGLTDSVSPFQKRGRGLCRGWTFADFHITLCERGISSKIKNNPFNTNVINYSDPTGWRRPWARRQQPSMAPYRNRMGKQPARRPS